jgi:hypothetical protein
MKREHGQDCWQYRNTHIRCKDCICDKSKGNVTPCTCHYKKHSKMIVDPCICENHIIVSPLDLPPAMTVTHFVDYYQLSRHRLFGSAVERAIRDGKIPAVKFEGVWRVFEKEAREWLAETLGVEELEFSPNGEIPLLPDPDM